METWPAVEDIIQLYCDRRRRPSSDENEREAIGHEQSLRRHLVRRLVASRLDCRPPGSNSSPGITSYHDTWPRDCSRPWTAYSSNAIATSDCLATERPLFFTRPSPLFVPLLTCYLRRRCIGACLWLRHVKRLYPHPHVQETFIRLTVECNNDYSVQNDESLRGHCTNERRARKQARKVRRDVI